MSDEADQADVEQERHLSAALANARAAAKRLELEATGRCWNCEEVLGNLAEPIPDLRFCDSDCRDDFAKRNAAARAARNIRAEDDV